MSTQTHIVKVQRSLDTSDKRPRVLVYNKDQTILFETTATPDLMGLFRDGEYKLYYKATLNHGTLQIGEQLPPQDF